MQLKLSRKFLFGILVVQAAILAVAFYWFSGKMAQSQLDREAGIFDVTTNLQLSERIRDPDNSLTDALVGTLRYISKLEGIFGACLFNEFQERVFCIPEFLSEQEKERLPREATASLLSDLHLDIAETATLYNQPAYVLQMDIPLKGSRDQIIGYLRFYRDAEEFARAMNNQRFLLWSLGVLAIILTGAITAFLFSAYSGRLERSERILRAKNEELLNAQRHLLLSTQMTAVGSMTAHLIHDLKSYANLITGCLAATRQQEEANGKTLEEAERISREMATRIREFLALLRNNSADFQSTYAPDEVLTILLQKLKPVAEQAHLTLDFQNHMESFAVDFRKGNFLILILQNLLHNAIESTDPGKAVHLRLSKSGSAAEFLVSDEGKGIPEDERGQLFLPQNSLKKGGTGLGLALCAQMAYHIGAEIDLVSSGPEGSQFRISLPLGENEFHSNHGTN